MAKEEETSEFRNCLVGKRFGSVTSQSTIPISDDRFSTILFIVSYNVSSNTI